MDDRVGDFECIDLHDRVQASDDGKILLGTLLPILYTIESKETRK